MANKTILKINSKTWVETSKPKKEHTGIIKKYQKIVDSPKSSNRVGEMIDSLNHDPSLDYRGVNFSDSYNYRLGLNLVKYRGIKY